MLPHGNNQFNGRFDSFEWSAPYYETPEEVLTAIRKLQITGKTIKDIRVIGTVFDKGLTSKVCTLLSDVGVDLRVNSWKEYPHLNDIKVPWEVKACEPLQFVFDDNTTFEILPIGNGGARVATNTIPVEINDGLNRSNFKSNIFFADFIGRQLENFDLLIKTITKSYINFYTLKDGKGVKERSRLYQYRFYFGHPYVFTLEQGFESYYNIVLKGDSKRFDHTKISYQRVKESFSEINQVFICNGRDAGGTFWIVPINSDSKLDDQFPFFDNFGISIDDYWVEDYLSEFLYQYFDPSIQEVNEDYPKERKHFDWYDVNLYTFDSIKKMLSDIRRAADLLVNDYDHPELEQIKKHLPWHLYTDKHSDELTETEKNALRQKGVPIAVDFYQRFIDRMEKMMALPGRDMISFAGP